MYKNRVEISIASRSYTIIGEDDEAHIIKVGQLVDKNVRELTNAYPELSISDRAILAAVNVADEYIKTSEKLMKMIDSLNRSEQMLTEKLIELNREVDELKTNLKEAERQRKQKYRSSNTFEAPGERPEEDVEANKERTSPSSASIVYDMYATEPVKYPKEADAQDDKDYIATAVDDGDDQDDWDDYLARVDAQINGKKSSDAVKDTVKQSETTAKESFETKVEKTKEAPPQMDVLDALKAEKMKNDDEDDDISGSISQTEQKQVVKPDEDFDLGPWLSANQKTQTKKEEINIDIDDSDEEDDEIFQTKFDLSEGDTRVESDEYPDTSMLDDNRYKGYGQE